MRSRWLLSTLGVIPVALCQHSIPSNDSESLLWGAYRSNLYFGMRPRVPQSLMTGLMWFGTHEYPSITSMTRQGDGLDSYTWISFDAREGGTQVLKDGYNNVELNTELLKVPGGGNGGSWAVRIKGKPLNPTRPSRNALIFYAGLEGLGGLEMDTEQDEDGVEGPISFSGYSRELDEFTLRIVDGPANKHVTGGLHAEDFERRTGKTHFAGIRVPPGDVWKAKDAFLELLLAHAKEVLDPFQKPGTPPPDPSYTLQLPDVNHESSNMFAVQKFFDGPFQFDVFYESKSAKHELSSDMLDIGIPALSDKLANRFEKTFPVPPGPEHDSLLAFSQVITANLIGGIGYFYGRSIVDRGFAYEWDEEDEDADEDDRKRTQGARLTPPKELLTATPSRSFFPRGFYWDEGFHLLHIGEWDNDLSHTHYSSLEILKDWINLIDEDGWVAREQILGEEARSKVPPEFQTQVPNYANPPTLTMAVTAFIDRVRALSFGPSDAELGMEFGTRGIQMPLSAAKTSTPGRFYLDHKEAMTYLRSIYAPLRRHYDWFRRTQRGQLKQYGRRPRSRTEAYRWRGRSATHVLTSGMDDYPRGPASAGELHLDLHSWVGFFSRTMREIAEFLGEEDDRVLFAEIEQAVKDNLVDLYWSEEEQMYCDVGVSDEDESQHVCHKGYLSLFPLMLELLPVDSPHVGSILELLHDPNHLWSPYGIRSLSASHPEFGQGENYWKGPIWVQMNYLVLRALYKTYAAEEGPFREISKTIYSQLRQNIISNEYERTGYVWEQYDATTGEGRRSHPFTGWTSMMTLIISEKY
ncbi:glycoside hydrolase [Vararia minispora EC-137]|uniref:Glycoside hydrolase n=1 Tax=Vararia minispora EC-137 TaxID=1314806 RepID=A0ACB8QN21_9AGAM|nr:glycoside hydrolase [Vararia minispora EC-137]